MANRKPEHVTISVQLPAGYRERLIAYAQSLKLSPSEAIQFMIDNQLGQKGDIECVRDLAHKGLDEAFDNYLRRINDTCS